MTMRRRRRFLQSALAAVAAFVAHSAKASISPPEGIASGKIYCEVCDGFQPLLVEKPHVGMRPEDGLWGDVMCARCRFVIATVDYT
jgi:hypothetical protein